MNARILSVACAALLAPAALLAAPAASGTSAGSGATFAVASVFAGGAASAFETSDPRCGRGRAWGCRRDRWDDRYDDRYDRRADRWERERWERDRWEREERWDRIRYERARYRARYGYYDRGYARYDGYAVACLRAGGRVLGATLVICVP